ncbi:M15 family metallopeptidase [uncultured Chloroflexus sp.]|uniref:M15 family metallopeptidase n=1 Tax=uncultured Chloroflexus sp. TaxID=214040 RepID=UPI00263991D1|nr:M15 family metallopeptidase [uncultured Chloroflexus sp.]
MSSAEVQAITVGRPDRAGRSRAGSPTALVVVVADAQPAAAALAAYQSVEAAMLPHFYLDRNGDLYQLVSTTRAGHGLGRAIWRGRSHNLDRVAVIISLEAPALTDLSEAQATVLADWLPLLLVQHDLLLADVSRLATDILGRNRVQPYLPPPPSVASADGLLLGRSVRSPEQELWVGLATVTWRQRGAQLRLNQAFSLHWGKFDLGAPLAANEPPPVALDGKTYNFQVFARDTIFNEGTQYAAVQSLANLLGPDIGAIPTGGVSRALIEASYRSALKASAARAPLEGKTEFRADWRFHFVALQANLGPALSGNYVTADRAFAVQVFAGDTLYTPMSRQSGCFFLSLTDPTSPQYAQLWAETYKVAGVPYNPTDPFHQRALELKLGTPLSGVLHETINGAPYDLQVFAYDTLYRGPDGVIRRMSELPRPAEVQTWQPRPAVAPAQPAQPVPQPAAPAPVSSISTAPEVVRAGPPRRDPNWPPMPDFNILTDRNGQRERILGKIEWVRKSGDDITITNDWAAQNLIEVSIPQLARFRNTNGGQIKFHRLAADQLRRLWQAWEDAGLLHLVLTFDGAWWPRTIRNNPTTLSNHAYGTAFDINAQWNAFYKPAALVGDRGSVRELVPIANALGFFWGGHWNYDGRGASDGMHFEWAVAR